MEHPLPYQPSDVSPVHDFSIGSPTEALAALDLIDVLMERVSKSGFGRSNRLRLEEDLTGAHDALVVELTATLAAWADSRS